MFKRSRIFGVLVLIIAFTSMGYADQPRMTAARANLIQARNQLQAAVRNKGGHRANAVGLINSAIAEINTGIRFDRRRNNHAQASLREDFAFLSSPDQPLMQRALDNLRSAKSNLEAATNDKGGHRVRALGFVNRAIEEVKLGIDAGE